MGSRRTRPIPSRRGSEYIHYREARLYWGNNNIITLSLRPSSSTVLSICRPALHPEGKDYIIVLGYDLSGGLQIDIAATACSPTIATTRCPGRVDFFSPHWDRHGTARNIQPVVDDLHLIRRHPHGNQVLFDRSRNGDEAVGAVVGQPGQNPGYPRFGL